MLGCRNGISAADYYGGTGSLVLYLYSIRIHDGKQITLRLIRETDTVLSFNYISIVTCYLHTVYTLYTVEVLLISQVLNSQSV